MEVWEEVKARSIYLNVISLEMKGEAKRIHNISGTRKARIEF